MHTNVSQAFLLFLKLCADLFKYRNPTVSLQLYFWQAYELHWVYSDSKFNLDIHKNLNSIP